MTVQRDAPALQGELREVQFIGESLKSEAAEAFHEFQSSQEINSILVLTRSTQFVETVEDWLDEAGAPESDLHVTVQSLTQHASRVRTADAVDRRVATRTQQLATVAIEANDADWDDTPFLRRASQQDSFLSDLSMLVTSILTQDISADDVTDPDLRAIVRFAHRVNERLNTAGLTDLTRVIHVANRALADGAELSLPDAVLVLNFEEFADREREYVARISEGRNLVCIAQQAASVYRISETPGNPSDVEGLTRCEKSFESSPRTQPEAVATRLATGKSHNGDDLPGSVFQLQDKTFETSIRSIAEEIHQLQADDSQIEYHDIAVAVRDTRGPLADVVQSLWNQNVPVTSTTASGLEYDPAARELYHALQAMVAVRGDNEIPPGVRESLESRTQNIQGEVDAHAIVSDQIETAVDQARFDEALRSWVRGTELKGRIARESDAIQARISYENVEEVLRLAQFVEEHDLCTTWERFLKLIELFYGQSASTQLSDNLQTNTTGVRVDTIRSLKGDRRDVVFVVGVVEEEFPADLPTNPLFPERRAREIDNFPLLVCPEDTTVRDTFPTVDDFYDPVRTYYREMDRRLLAIAAQTAQRRLYFSTYQQDRAGLAQHRPSRFLNIISNEFDIEIKHGDKRSKSPGHRVITTFEESRQELWEATVTGPLDITDLQSRFKTVQAILESQEEDRIRDALQTRVDFVRGDIRRPSPTNTAVDPSNPETDQ